MNDTVSSIPIALLPQYLHHIMVKHRSKLLAPLQIQMIDIPTFRKTESFRREVVQEMGTCSPEYAPYDRVELIQTSLGIVLAENLRGGRYE